MMGHSFYLKKRVLYIVGVTCQAVQYSKMQSELWQRIYKEAQRTGHPFPDKMADTAIKCRKTSIIHQKERRAVVQITQVPAQVKDAPGPKKPTASNEPKCRARTLEGRACTFTCKTGEFFCKKHCNII